MVKTFHIKPNTARYICGIRKSTEFVTKNFPEYNKESIFELDRLCLGIMIKEQENENFILFHSNVHSWGYEEWYAIYCKKTKQVCLELCFAISSENIKINLCKDEITLTINILDEDDWHISNYEFIEPRIYDKFIVTKTDKVTTIKCDDEICSFVRYRNNVYVTSHVNNSQEGFIEHQWEHNHIYFYLN